MNKELIEALNILEKEKDIDVYKRQAVVCSLKFIYLQCALAHVQSILFPKLTVI